MKETLPKFSIFIIILSLFSCGGWGLAIDKHLTDHFYVKAVDSKEGAQLIYDDSSDGSSGLLVDMSVIAIGYNDDFIIVKQHPIQNLLTSDIDTIISDVDTIIYFIIDINEFKKQKEKFIPGEIVTLTRKVYNKDINGNDSLYTAQFPSKVLTYEPKEAIGLTFEEFKTKRKIMNIPDSLDFTIKIGKSDGN